MPTTKTKAQILGTKKNYRSNCPYCNRKMSHEGDADRRPSIDHVIPKSRGGKETIWCCIRCNNMKADMMPEEWARFRKENPDWFYWTGWKIAQWRRANR